VFGAQGSKILKLQKYVFYVRAQSQEHPLHYIAVELSDYTAIYFHLTCFRFAQARPIGFIRVPSPDSFLLATVWSS